MRIDFSTMLWNSVIINKLAGSMERAGKAGRKSVGDFRAFQKQT